MDRFEQYRPLLWSLAYRMLGSAAEAEDIVQEAYLRVHDSADQVIVSERAYLSSIVTRLCLDHWKSARVKRETYVGPWLPEPVSTHAPADPESISLAFLVLLESLTPLERAVYLLSQVFDYSHAEVAAIVGRDEAACRQLLHRARERVQERRPRFASSPDSHRTLVEQFAKACAEGDLTGLERLLSKEATAWSDGGGKVHAAERPIVGAQKIARTFVGLRRLAQSAIIRIEELNGQPTLVVTLRGVIVSVIDFESDGVQIVAIRTVANPDKLARLTATLAS